MDIKLFDYVVSHRKYEDEDNENKDTQTFTIQMFGINELGESFSIEIPDFKPCFYCRVTDSFSSTKKKIFLDHIKSKIGPYYSDSIVDCVLIKRKKLDGFDGQRDHKFLCFKFKGLPSFNKVKNLWYDEIPSPKSRFGKSMILKKFGYKFNGDSFFLYESNIPPLLRYFHIKEISPSGWIHIDDYIEIEDKTTTCTYEIQASAKDIQPLQKETLVPYKICSFDIEASSSHGDFPMPIKDYKKLSQNIIDLSSSHFINTPYLKRCIYTAFGYDNIAGIERIYPKKPITVEQLESLFDKFIQAPLTNYDEYVGERNEALDLDENDSDSEHEQVEYVPYDTSSTIEKMLADNDYHKDCKMIELTKSLNAFFPSVEGDKVTFIGSTFIKYGEKKPYLNHCIVLGGCSPIENIELECYPTEKQVLLAWTELIKRENPDILIGYNIFGFDENFLFKRSLETKCVNSFLELSKNKNSLAGSMYDGKWKIEETTVSLASGEYELKYFKMDGRMQFDLYTVFRRDYNLESYKLDDVSAYFIGDKVSRIEHVENTTIIYTKNLQGLEKTNYVVFEEISHTNDLYRNGKKFKVIDIQKDHFILHSIINPNMKKEVRWCLAKDDVDHHDIFRLSNGTDDDRAIIATYCIQDCNLVHHLMNKIDLLTGLVEMSNICSVPIQYLLMRGQTIKLTSYLAKKCREKNVLMPVLQSSDFDKDDGYEGAIVLDPKCNVYSDDPIAVCDYSSLYPSCMISESISHDSKTWTKEYDLDGNLIFETGKKDEHGRFIYDNLPGYQYVDIKYDTYKYVRKTPKAAATKVISGYKICRFAQFPEGKPIIPSILEELLAARSATRKLIPKQTDEFMKNILDKRQLAYKVTANSLYGGCGAKVSSFYDKDVAASCTSTGRKLLIYAKTVIEEVYKGRVCDTKMYGQVMTNAEYVYGDTDSVFFKFNLTTLEGEKIIGKKALDITIELAKEAGHLASMFLKPPHDLEYEKTFLPLVLLSKKRYVGMLYENDSDHCKRKSMGIVLKRRDNAPIVKDIYGGIIDILMKEHDIQKSIDFVKDSLHQLVSGKINIDKLIITKSLKSSYKNPLQVAHKVLAERIGTRDPGNKPRAGERIRFVYIKGDKKKLQGERIETPEFIKDHQLALDYNHYITNQIMKPIQQVYELVLEEIPEFNQEKFYQSLQPFKESLTPDKYEKKVTMLRNKEVKRLIFDEFLV
jgi:DNA polymerase elongation subunit (family B)